jgi:hypothetical protein
LSRGQFNANQEKIIFSDTALAISDASLITGGTVEYEKRGSVQLEVSGMGTIGAQMAQRLSRYVELPEELNLRSPLKIAAGRLAWRSGGEISFRGQVIVGGGARLSLDAVKQPQGLALQDLTIDDGGRRARMSFQLAKNNLDLSFSGELTQQTIDKVFVSFPTKDSSLRGEIQLSASLADPVWVSARGQLSGSHLPIPLGAEKALAESFNIEAGKDHVLIRSADLRWRNSRLRVAGKVAGAKEVLRLDLDVSGDRLGSEDLDLIFGREGGPRHKTARGVLSLPRVEGIIRLKVDSFAADRFTLSPLQIRAAISSSSVTAEIERGVVCGINTTGRFEVANRDIDLDLQLSATDAQLEPATVCLTNQQNDVKGTYSLRARLVGRGDRGQLPRFLKGNFEFSARNGEFIRSPGIDATFDYLNETGDFKVAFPDLDRESFPYRFVGVKGRIDGKMLVGEEINLESSLLNLSGQGTVDLERKQIDGKGIIAVLKPADEVITRIPVIGSMVGGSLVGIPVRVTGSLERPNVTYLSPADVGAELLNVPLRILGIPLGAMRLFTPSGDLRDKDITK